MKKKVEFYWKHNLGVHTKHNVQKIGEYLTAARTKGLSDVDIVEDNRSKGKVLFDYFTQDAELALLRLNKLELSKIERNIVFDDDGVSKKPINQFWRVPAELKKKPTKSFTKEQEMEVVTFKEAFEDSDTWEYLVESARKQVRIMVRKLAQLIEISELRNIVEEELADLEKEVA